MSGSDVSPHYADVSIRLDPLPPPFAVRFVVEGITATLVAEGEIDMATADELAAALDGLAGRGCTTVRRDLGAVSFLDSTGLTVLATRLREGRDLCVVNASDRVTDVLRATGLDVALTPAAGPDRPSATSEPG